MIYIIVFFLAACWIWIIIDLKKTPLNLYEMKSVPAKRSNSILNFNSVETENESGSTDELCFNEIYKKKDLEVA